MSWIEAIWLAEIHREVYVAILKSWVPYGRQGKFARTAGISPGFLSYLYALDDPLEDRSPTRRSPSPQTALRIANALPAPAEIKRSLIENMELSHVHAARAYYKIQQLIEQRELGDLLAKLKEVHRQAVFGTDAGEVKRAYRAIREIGTRVIRSISPTISPASFAQVCLYIHDAQCVLDRADEALKYARLAHLILMNRELVEPGFPSEQWNNLEINAIRGQAVAYHNLGLDRKVPALITQSCLTSAYKNSADFWKPLVDRDLINALERTPRFSIREARKLAREAGTICEKSGDEFTLFLVRESLLRCLIKRGRLKQAQDVFQEEMDRLSRLPYAGFLHQALLLKSGAWLAWETGDRSTWQYLIREAITLMHQAGLRHQLRALRRQYGTHLFPVLDELKSRE